MCIRDRTTIRGEDAPLLEVFLVSLLIYCGLRFLSLGLIDEDLIAINAIILFSRSKMEFEYDNMYK